MTTYILDAYLPDPAWFVRPSRLHGIAHPTRVLLWAAALLDALDMTANRAELLTAAAVHDTQRHDDGVDPDHGRRAAMWVLETFPEVALDRAATLDLALVAALCRDHNRSDRPLYPELAILKDADALDRARLGNLDPSRLRHAASHALIEPAKTLYRLTRDATDAETVRAAAIELGVWR